MGGYARDIVASEEALKELLELIQSGQLVRAEARVENMIEDAKSASVKYADVNSPDHVEGDESEGLIEY